MSTKRVNKRTRYEPLPLRGSKHRTSSQSRTIWAARSRSVGTNRASSANEYVCTIERNQNGKYSVRIRASFGAGRRLESASRSRAGWNLPVYFLASSFSAAMKKLEESLQLLQRNEERLRFWGVERSDDPN